MSAEFEGLLLPDNAVKWRLLITWPSFHETQLPSVCHWETRLGSSSDRREVWSGTQAACGHLFDTFADLHSPQWPSGGDHWFVGKSDCVRRSVRKWPLITSSLSKHCKDEFMASIWSFKLAWCSTMVHSESNTQCYLDIDSLPHAVWELSEIQFQSPKKKKVFRFQLVLPSQEVGQELKVSKPTGDITSYMHSLGWIRHLLRLEI